ncbi:MAG: ABC transporter substrate-binding protein [Beutenbergiaceae bacterium]
MRLKTAAGIAALAGILLVGCTDQGWGRLPDPDATSTTGGQAPAAPGECSPATMPTLTDGVLTVGTSVPYEPWYVGDDPSTGDGFESALIYAVAAELGFEQVEWETVTFEQIVSPSIKPFDIAAYQTSITPERAQAVDFSSPYLTSRQGVIVPGDSDLAQAASLADFTGVRVGVTASQTSLTIAQNAWGQSVELVPYDDAGLAMEALTATQVAAVVMDVDQAVSVTEVYYPGTAVVGTLPSGGVAEQLGLVLDLESELTECVSAAVDSLEADGRLAQLRTQWLRSDDIPELA